MLRIAAGQEEGGRVAVHLEGQLVGPWVAQLEEVCAPLLARGLALTLGLSSVSFVSREGVELLWRLRAGRVDLVGCSSFVSEQLKPADGAAPDSSQRGVAGDRRAGR